MDQYNTLRKMAHIEYGGGNLGTEKAVDEFYNKESDDRDTVNLGQPVPSPKPTGTAKKLIEPGTLAMVSLFLF